MVPSLLPSSYVPMIVTSADIKLASIAWGFTMGVGALTVWKAMKQTQRIARKKRFWSTYVWMVWGEIAACLVFAIICWLYLNGNIPPSFGFYFAILTCWSLQVQFLLQIIINRIAIIDHQTRRIVYLKYGVAFIVTAINISVYCIWIPARLQISGKYVHINDIWDRCEKSIYLLIDAGLNWRFIYVVRENLVKMGLVKYREVMRVNIAIVVLSLSMDVLIIAMMSLKNTFVYCQFHPLAYIVKLHIELHLADLIADIAKRREHTPSSFPDSNPQSNPRLSHHPYPRRSHNHAHVQAPTKPPASFPRSKSRTEFVEMGGGITKTQDVKVETYSLDKGSEVSVVDGSWKCDVVSGDQVPLSEGEGWEMKGRQESSRRGDEFPS